MRQLNDQVLEDSTLEFADDDRVYLGHNLVLRRCRLHFATRAREAVITAKVRFEGCEIHAARPLTGINWTCAECVDCTFQGAFRDSRFGCWPEYAARVGISGTIQRCDIRQAELHLCEFFGPSFQALQLALPSWPCFTCVQPKRFFPALGERGDLPPWARWWIAIHGRSAELADPSLVAMSFHAPALVKSISRDTPCTVDEVRALLATVEHVIL
jgi:hypothetical protein